VHACDGTMTCGLVSVWCKAGYSTGCLAAPRTNAFVYPMIGWRGMLMAGPSALSREQAAMKPVWS
jgi:hypothetical protein